MIAPSRNSGGVHWPAVGWWLVFSFGWALILISLVQKLFVLCLAAAGLLGFLTLCAFDIWQAWRNRRALQDEYLRKGYGPRTKDTTDTTGILGEAGEKNFERRFNAGDQS